MMKRTRWWIIAIWLVGTLAAQESELFDGGQLDSAPKPKKQVVPEYPFAMRVAGLNGRVTVEFVVAKDGRVVNAHVSESNNAWFERPALDAVEKWTFSPGMKDGRAVNTRCSIDIPFSLTTGGEEPWQVPRLKDPSKLPPEVRWDIAPVPVNTAFPVYPFNDVVKEAKGKVKIGFVVGRDGRVASSKIITSGTPEMNLAVAAALDAWRFIPARKSDGSACSAFLSLEYEFVPHGRGDVPLSDSALSILRGVRKNRAFATLKELDEPLKPRGRRSPTYPSALREKGETGEAEIEFFIDEKGDAQLPRIVSATAPEFGYAAVQAVATWRFSAPKKNGKSVVVRTTISVGFSLHEPKEQAPDKHSL